MKNKIISNVTFGESRVALLEEDKIKELHIERISNPLVVGNIYLGKIVRVVPGVKAAFVDIGLSSAAFLSLDDLLEVEAEEIEESSKQSKVITHLKLGEKIIVQVTKSPVAKKGARVSAHISIPGRNIVYLPNDHRIGISRRIKGKHEKEKIKSIALKVKELNGGIIIRTVAENEDENNIIKEAIYLGDLWKSIINNAVNLTPPYLLYKEQPLVVRTCRDLFGNNYDKFILDDKNSYDQVVSFLNQFSPDKVSQVAYYNSSEPIFSKYNIEDQIKINLSHKIYLPSGGFIVIDQTEALTVIDVNSGSYVGVKDIEHTAFQTNMEAVKLIAYQLRFRNIGGIIVVDFIDMQDKNNKKEVIKTLKKELSYDKTKTVVANFTELGLIQITRKRTELSLGSSLFETCSYCEGTGRLKTPLTLLYEAGRDMRKRFLPLTGKKVSIHMHPQVIDEINSHHKEVLEDIEFEFKCKIEMIKEKSFHKEHYVINV